MNWKLDVDEIFDVYIELWWKINIIIVGDRCVSVGWLWERSIGMF